MYEHIEDLLALIESRRLPSNTVFSYRFLPEMEHESYANRNMWNSFWRATS